MLTYIFIFDGGGGPNMTPIPPHTHTTLRRNTLHPLILLKTKFKIWTII